MGAQVIIWTEAENDLIRRHYPTGGAKGCVEHLPGRTEAAIRKQARRLDVHKVTKSGKTDGRIRAGKASRREWNAAEEALLRKVYHNKPPAELVEMFGRSFKAIAGKANYMGLSRQFVSAVKPEEMQDVPLPAMDLLDSLACIRLRKWAHDCANTEADLRPHKGVACG